MVGIAALVFWFLWLIAAGLDSPPTASYINRNYAGVSHPDTDLPMAVFGTLGWFLTVLWVVLDAHYRRQRHVAWGLLALVTGPIGFIIYYVTRQRVRPICLHCGTNLPDPSQPCPACGRHTLCGTALSRANSLYAGLSNSLVRGPADQAKETAKHLCFALGAVVLIGAPLALIVMRSGSLVGSLFYLVWAICIPALAVLVAWWVYLDATWRRMEAVPWAILTLVTQLIGLVTYLVIRYPDPHTCPRCGAGLATGLKRCPYCGGEAEPTCPRCQAAVKPDWVYCPSCSTKLPDRQPQAANAAEPAPVAPAVPTLTITGTVTDAATGMPISGAEVKIDSKSDAGSAVTDAHGRFAIGDLLPRPYVVLASAQGYLGTSTGFTPSATGPTPLSIVLYPSHGG